MIADIFYPIFTLKITVLACLMQKKNWRPRPPGHLSRPPGGFTTPPIPPVAKKKKRCVHIFSELSPDIFENI